jgi:uncharacterized protein (TIGR02145 family)
MNNWTTLFSDLYFYSLFNHRNLDTITDYDGNIYHTIEIGGQLWVLENLRTTHYADGTAIPNLTLAANWTAENGTPGHDGAYVWYNNNIVNMNPYGALYNWFAVNNAHGLALFRSNGHIVPNVRIPNRADFQTLSLAFGGDFAAGWDLCSTDTLLAWASGIGFSNISGFTAVGSGNRNWFNGNFNYLMGVEIFWIANLVDAAHAYSRYLQDASGQFIEENNRELAWGLSVRCIIDL